MVIVFDALALIVHKDNAPYRGRELVEKMRELIPRQQILISRSKPRLATTLLRVQR